VAENGAVALIPEVEALRVEYAQDKTTRERNAVRLREVAQRVLREVPGALLARDSAGRVTDIAIDHSEFVHLDEAAIARVVEVMRAEEATAALAPGADEREEGGPRCVRFSDGTEMYLP